MNNDTGADTLTDRQAKILTAALILSWAIAAALILIPVYILSMPYDCALGGCF